MKMQNAQPTLLYLHFIIGRTTKQSLPVRKLGTMTRTQFHDVIRQIAREECRSASRLVSGGGRIKDTLAELIRDDEKEIDGVLTRVAEMEITAQDRD